MNSRYVHAVWCDDIRLEMGNKRSFMGVYGPILYVSEIPAVLPKLCVWMTFRSPADKPLKSLIFRVLDSDKILVETTSDETHLKTAFDSTVADSGSSPNLFVSLDMQVMLAPFAIEAPKILRLRVIADGEEFRGAQLKIEQATIN